MSRRSIYGDLARYYDTIYSFKDYDFEATRLAVLIRRYKRSPGRRLLEVACGTGKHAKALSKRFEVTATDINPGMLAVARKNVPGVTFRRADMTKLDLGRKFDVITCLFSSIGYVKTHANLRKTLEGIARHLVPGGVAIIEPWFSRKAFHPGAPFAGTFGNGDLRIARVTMSRVRGLLSIIDMHYLVAHRGGSVRHFVDRHELALFEPDRFLAIMRAAGLKARFLTRGLMPDRGLYVGVREPEGRSR
ncbi:MAG: class I SAM-dependent methyltransferase [Planctomycetota bacterium]